MHCRVDLISSERIIDSIDKSINLLLASIQFGSGTFDSAREMTDSESVGVLPAPDIRLLCEGFVLAVREMNVYRSASMYFIKEIICAVEVILISY
jgi:hypothetical protein